VKLVLSFQGVQIQEYALDRPVLSIGRGRRDENDIVIDHMGVSGTHAQIAMEGQSVILTDLKSTNGTFVNGQRVERVELRPNDWISIGKHIVTLKAGPR
jgi:pSer/pThr/pTyr-binding forkhead associated (FHA) protein